MRPRYVCPDTVSAVRWWHSPRVAVDHVLRLAVFSNIVIGLAGASVAATTMVLAGMRVRSLPLVFVFVVTWLVYTVNRFTDRIEDAQNVPDRREFVEAYGRIIAVTGASCYLVLVAIVARDIPRMLPIALLPPLAIAFYGTSLAKRMFVVKNGVVGLMWAMIPFGIGLYAGFSASVWLMTAVVGVHIALAAALFDIKDVPGDRAIGSVTLPVLVGVRRTRGIVAVGACCVGGLVVGGILWAGPVVIPLGLYPLHLLTVSLLATDNRGPLFYGLVIDGEHLLVAAIAVTVTAL